MSITGQETSKAPRPEHFRNFNGYCRAMDEWMRERWAALDAEMRELRS